MAPADAPALERLVHGGLPRLMAYPALVSIFSQPTAVSSSSQSQSPSPRCYSSSFQPAVIATPSFSSSLSGWFCGAVTLRIADTRLRRRSHIVRMAPEEERMTRRSPLDFLIEWERPKPGRRPDILPQFSPMKTPLPPPLPTDPPEEDEEEEEKKEEEEEDPEEWADPGNPEKQ